MSRDPKPYVADVIPDGIRSLEWEHNDESYVALRSLHTLVLRDLTALDSLSVAWLQLPDAVPDDVAFCQLAEDAHRSEVARPISAQLNSD